MSDKPNSPREEGLTVLLSRGELNHVFPVYVTHYSRKASLTWDMFRLLHATAVAYHDEVDRHADTELRLHEAQRDIVNLRGWHELHDLQVTLRVLAEAERDAALREAEEHKRDAGRTISRASLIDRIRAIVTTCQTVRDYEIKLQDLQDDLRTLDAALAEKGKP